MKAQGFLRAKRRARKFYLLLQRLGALLFQGEIKIDRAKGPENFESFRNQPSTFHSGEYFLIK